MNTVADESLDDLLDDDLADLADDDGDAVPDPRAGVAYEDNIERDSPKETAALVSAFAQRRKREQDRFQQATDGEFWCALCFQTSEQKERFLEALKIIDLGDKYLDGLAVANRLGIDLEQVQLRAPAEKRDHRLLSIGTISQPRKGGE